MMYSRKTYIILNVLILLTSIASSSKGMQEGTDQVDTNSPSSSKKLNKSTDQMGTSTPSSSKGLKESLDQIETSTPNGFDKTTVEPAIYDYDDYKWVKPDPLGYDSSSCYWYTKASHLLKVLKAEEAMKVEYEEFTDRLLNLIRYDKSFLQVFDPLSLSDGLQNKENLSCFETLHGLSNMRKIQQTVSSSPRKNDVVEIDIDFQYPKLCVKCSNLLALDLQLNEEEWYLERVFRLGQYVNVCAKYVKGKMKILRNIENGHSEISHIQINDIRFQLDYAGNTKQIPKFVRPVREKLEKMLAPLERVVFEFLNSENHTLNLRTSIDGTYKRAGNCFLGDCALLEGITDFELIDRINASIVKSLSTLDPKVLDLTVPISGEGYPEMIYKDLIGLSKGEVVAYNKVKMPEKRGYRLEVAVRYPSLCVSAQFRKTTQPDQVLDLSLCSDPFQVNMNIYFVKGRFRLGLEDMRWEVPDLYNANVTTPFITYVQYRNHLLMGFYKCHLFYFAYDTVLMAVQSALLDFRRCNFGTCFKESWDEDEAPDTRNAAKFDFLSIHEDLFRV